MIALGTVWIGKYRVWATQSSPVTKPDPNDPSKQIEWPYYDVLVVREESDTLHYYVDLMKDDLFKHMFHLDERGKPTKNTDMVTYQAYLDRKDMGQPMWRMDGVDLNGIFTTLLYMSYECT
jgi:hypothetical protein